MYSNYEFYKSTYAKGNLKLTEQEFAYYASKATYLIVEMTLGKSDAMSDTEAVQYAVCECAERMKLSETSNEDETVNPNLVSEKVGEYTATYRQCSAAQKEAEVRDYISMPIRNYLAPLGLLYRGQ